jgi:hypothetical protein
MTWLNLLMSNGSGSARLTGSIAAGISLRLPRIEIPDLTAIRCEPGQIKTQTSQQLMMCVKPWFDRSSVTVELLDDDFPR